MTKINTDNGAVWWTGPLAIDADGAPDAYGPNNSGLDYTANAGHDGDWYGVLTDKDGDPVIQGPDDPKPGDFIATTALQDHSKAIDDPTRYVDSSKIRYVSVPSNAVKEYGLHCGDVALVHCAKTGQTAAAIVADVGPKDKWGEGSIALAAAVGLPTSPKNGGASEGVTIIVFKGSKTGWPRTNEDIAGQVQTLLNANGGPQHYGIG